VDCVRPKIFVKYFHFGWVAARLADDACRPSIHPGSALVSRSGAKMSAMGSIESMGD